MIFHSATMSSIEPQGATDLWMFVSVVFVITTIVAVFWSLLQRRRMADSVAKWESDRARLNAIQQELLDQKRWNEALLNHVPDAIWLKDIHGRYLAVNDAYARSLSIPRESIVGRRTEDVVPVHWRDRFLEEDAALIANRIPIQKEESLVFADGSVQWFESWKTAIWNDHREIIGTLGIARNVTVRKLAELEQQYQVARVTALINNVPDPMWLKDARLRYLVVNEAWLRLLEQATGSRCQVIGKTTEEIVSGHLAKFAQEHDVKILETKEAIRSEETVALLNGATEIFETWRRPVISACGEVLGLVGIARSILVLKAEQERLRQNRDWLEAIVDNVPDPLWLKDANRRYLAVNDAWCQALGADRQQVVGKRADEIFSQGIVDQISSDEAKILDSVAPLQKEESLILADGQLEWYQTWERSIRDAEGKPIGLVGIARNVTQSKIADAALAKYQLLSEQVRDVIVFFAPDTRRIVEANRAACECYGYSREEILRLCMTGIQPDIDLHLPPADAKMSGFGYRFEAFHYNRKGDSFPVEVRTQSGEVAGVPLVVCVIRDVTHRRNLENELRSLNADLERRVAERTKEALDLYHNAPCGYHSVGSDGIVLQINDTELSWLGYTRDEVEGKMHFAQLLMAEDALQFISVFGDFVAHRDLTHAEWNMRRRDGTPIPVLVQVRAVRDSNGKFIKTQSMAVDFSERRQLEARLRAAKEEAEAADRAKTIFLANISHELRTPLNAVLGFSQLMLRDPQLSERSRQHVLAVARNGEHLVELIGDVLEMARIESGKVELRMAPFDCHALVDDVRGMFEERARLKGLNFQIKMGQGPCHHLIGDATKIRQVLVNLLGNAIKFTRSGTVTWEMNGSQLPDGQLRINGAVEDTGPGMNPEEMTHLFEAFYQTQSGRDTEGGTGLGLRISRQFLRLMNGDISISSQPGIGTRCEFFFLVTLANPVQSIGSETLDSRIFRLAEPFVGTRVLVVDDEADNRTLMHDLLTPVGFRMHEVPDGIAALSEFSAHPYPLILMDLQMPEMDGYEAIRRIRNLPDGKNTVILAVTAGPVEQGRQKAIDAGANGCLGKPVRFEELFAWLEKLLRLKFIASDTPKDDGLSTQNQVRLPGELAAEFQAAAESADYHGLNQLVDHLSSLNPDLAHHLRTLVESYDYDQILRTCRIGGESLPPG